MKKLIATLYGLSLVCLIIATSYGASMLMGADNFIVQIFGNYMKVIAPIALVPIILCGARMAFIDGVFAPIFPTDPIALLYAFLGSCCMTLFFYKIEPFPINSIVLFAMEIVTFLTLSLGGLYFALIGKFSLPFPDVKDGSTFFPDVKNGVED